MSKPLTPALFAPIPQVGPCPVPPLLMAICVRYTCVRVLCRSLLSVLPAAFVQCSDRLRKQLDTAIATARQRPDSLTAYIQWQAEMQSHAQHRSAASLDNGANDTRSAGAASNIVRCASDALRAGLLAEVEALRMLLDVLRCVARGRGTCFKDPEAPGA